MLYLFIISWFIVAFGQPALCSWLGMVAAAIGYALFWRVASRIPSRKKRFWTGFFWMAAVQGVQLAWMRGHPFLYIYIVWMFVACLFGVQFGMLTAWITKKRLARIHFLLAISGAWVLCEWARLYILTGFSWNPVGLSLSSNVYSRQFASLFGVFGLSFWVIFVNLLFLKAWFEKKQLNFSLWIFAALLPYLYGWGQFASTKDSANEQAKIVLVQTAFPCEETLDVCIQNPVTYTSDLWRQIVSHLSQHQGEFIDLIALPENVVPMGTFFPVFDWEEVKLTFYEYFGEVSLPDLAPHLAWRDGDQWKVNNAYWLQAIADQFDSEVICGLEDRDYIARDAFNAYSVAYLFRPHSTMMQRYEKQVPVPMGEYIPFSWCRDLAARYGVTGSFCRGKGDKVLQGRKLTYGVSICYEETYSNIIYRTGTLGADLLVNITNDGWFISSGLPKQHLEHSRLRSVELGIPCVRACNTGVTCAIDAYGLEIASLGDGSAKWESTPGTLAISVPIHKYKTLYSYFGDLGILSISGTFLLGVFGLKKTK